MIGECPRGYICINNYNLISYLVLIIIILFFVGREYNNKLYQQLSSIKTDQLRMNNDITFNKDNIESTNQNIPPQTVVINKDISPQTVVINKDIELLNNPLLPPVRRNYHIDKDPYYTVPGVPINIPTRGYMGDYQQIGMLHKESINDESITPGNNSETNILPLFGKPLYSNSSKWLYYAGSDKFNNIKIPINHKNKDCSDDYGCSEIYDDDIVHIPAYNGNFKVKIYKYDKPRYLPFVY